MSVFLAQAGETLAELVAADMISSHVVMDIMYSSFGEHPDDTTRQRCVACLAAYCIRLTLLGVPASSVCCLRDLLMLLPLVLPQVLHVLLLTHCNGFWDWLAEMLAHPVQQHLTTSCHLWHALIATKFSGL